VAFLAVVVLAVRAALRALQQRRPREESWPILFLLSWLLVPTVLTVIAYAAGEPIELARVVILVAAPLALLLAWGLMRPAVMPALGVAGVAVLLALRLAQVIPSYGVSPEPWSAVTAHVLKSTPADRPACIAFYPQDGREVVDYYLLRAAGGGANNPAPAPALRPVLPSLSWGTVRPYVERYGTLNAGQPARVAGQCPRLWLLASHQGQASGTHQSVVNVRRYRRLEDELRALYPHSTLRTFGWASAIRVWLFSR
jgi:hypothetical protein